MCPTWKFFSVIPEHSKEAAHHCNSTPICQKLITIIYNEHKHNKIDIISSHHSPQDQDSKRLPFEQAEFGIAGLETLLPISLDLHFNGCMKLIDLIDKLETISL